MDKEIVSFLLFIICHVNLAYAQCVVEGNIYVRQSLKPVVNGDVWLKQQGKTVQKTSSDEKGRYVLKNVPAGSYSVEVTCMGYKSLSDTLRLVSTLRKNFELEEDSKKLNGVTVVADRSQTVKRTADGLIFYLSSRAKKMSNPFMALQEIPVLISDANTSTVKMLNGESPLILIDGHRINSGIAPVKPSDIESVEVTNVVSARYLQEGVTSIVNLKLKRHTRPYVWLEGATRHEIPLHQGFGVGYFEVGNKKISLYGRASFGYTYHEDTKSSVSRMNTGYTQSYNQSARADKDRWLGELLWKYQITSKDYFAAQLYHTYEDAEEKDDAGGIYQSETPQAYQFDARSKNQSDILTSGMYYEHSFTKDKQLELRFSYIFNKNKYDQQRADYYDERVIHADARYKNKRHSGSFNLDYSASFSNHSSLIAGLQALYVADEIQNVTGDDLFFTHRNYNQYAYVGYGGAYKRLFYNASVGLEGIWAKAGYVRYSYFRPRANASVTWKANDRNSVLLSYRLVNTAPDVAYLNPYNTSTDSLWVSVGNPELKPQMTHSSDISYTLNVGRWFITPQASYSFVYDMIESQGYNRGGVYYSSYVNQGRFSQTSAGVNLSYRFNWGMMYAGGGWDASFFTGQPERDSFWGSWGFNARAGKFSFYGNVAYNSRDYTALGYTTYLRPSLADVQLNYNFTPDFYIGICLQHFTGEYRQKTYLTDGSYRSSICKRYKEKNLRPWILLRYTFRKNTDKKHKLGNVLDGEEKGISIVR